jgi:hypothetical protein
MTWSDILSPHNLAFIIAVVVSAIILGFAVIILGRIRSGDISLFGIIAEPDGKKASLSRFQFLLFTFVIAGLYLVLSLESGTFVDIPESVLALLGISGGSYLISKGIGKTPPKGDAPAPTISKHIDD